MTISSEKLIAAGYTRWKFTPDEYTFAQHQKRVTDQDGRTKYFINIDETKGWNPTVNSTDEFHNFWPSIQFQIKIADTFQSIDVRCIQWFNESGKYSGITIEQMEEYLDSVWGRLNGEFYE